MDFYLGIDFGTSGARAVAIDSTGAVGAHAIAEFAESSSWAEWQRVLFELMGQLPQACRTGARSIAINGTSSTVLLCDAQGQPVTPALLYNDDRGVTELEHLRHRLERWDALTPGSEIVLSATSSLVKLLWWQRQALPGAQYLLHQADWLGFLLHGQLGISDYHNSLKLGYDVRRLCYPEWMVSLNVEPLLPRVVPPGTPIAPVLGAIATQFGLPGNCQVCAGTTDSIAAFLASGATAIGEAVTSLGSTLVLKLLSHTPVDSQQYGIYSHRLGDRWLVGGASNTGGAVLKQFFTPDQLERLSAEIDPDRESPWDYYPLTQPGERFPLNDAQLQPRLEPRSPDPVEFLHGLLESMARIEAKGYQRLQELGATPLRCVYTAGGGAANDPWARMRSRQLGVSVVRSAHTEAAYGTALLAQRGVTCALDG
jgi:D-ribulokinase